MKAKSPRKSVPRVRQFPEIREYMTPSPYTIAPNRSLSAAHQAMRDHQVRHLPVIEHGHVVGVVSQRDLALIESLPGVNPTDVRVEEAMVRDVFTVPPEMPIGEADRDPHRAEAGLGHRLRGRQGDRGLHHHRRPGGAAQPARAPLRHIDRKPRAAGAQSDAGVSKRRLRGQRRRPAAAHPGRIPAASVSLPRGACPGHRRLLRVVADHRRRSAGWLLPGGA